VEKIAELESQSDDLRGALQKVRALPFADDQRTALIAWSYAGEAAWIVAQGDARIGILIGLDSNVRSNWVYQSRDALAAAAAVPVAAEVVSFDRKTKDFESLSHGNFNALEGLIPAVMGIERVQRWSSPGPAAKSGYERLSRSVAEALGGAFKKTPPRYEKVELTAADKSQVTAEIHRPARTTGRCAALFHQSGSSRGEYRTIGPELARMGYTALAIDVRWGRVDRWNDVVNETAARHGTFAAVERGDRERIQAIRAGEAHDLDVAIDWLRAHGCTQPIVVWGSSIQANGVFELALRRSNEVGAIVDVSPGEYKKDEPDRMKGLVAGVRQPSLVIWGRDERELSKPIFDALPDGHKQSYESTSRHGNAVFFEDPVAWKTLRAFIETIEGARR
jgi:dienelactone hydrolase